MPVSFRNAVLTWLGWLLLFIQSISNPVLPDANEIPFKKTGRGDAVDCHVDGRASNRQMRAKTILPIHIYKLDNHAYLQNSYTFARYYDILRRKN